MNKIIYVPALFVVVFIVAFGSFKLWEFGKQINYKLSYQKMVEETVKKMVKPEALK